MRHKSGLEKFFAEQEARVLNALSGFKRAKAQLDMGGIWNDDAEAQALLAQLQALYGRAVEDGTDAAESLGVPITPTPQDRYAALEPTFAQRVTDITHTTRDAIAAQLAEGLRRGYSTTQIAQGVPDEAYQGITGVFDQARGYRAEMIARTETMFAFNTAAVQSYQDSGVVDEVEILDGDYDPECEEMNHQVVPLDEALGLVDDEHPNGTRAILPIVSCADIGAGSAAEAASAEAEAESA